MPQTRADIISRLQTDIRRLEGFKPLDGPAPDLALGAIQKAFPKGIFPTGAVHEFLPAEAGDQAAVYGFIMGLMSRMMANHDITFWISAKRRLFPPAAANFGIQPDRLIFVDVPKEQDVMPILYEALKCSAVSAVVAEARNMDFTTSRRLQLAVEQSKATGFVIRNPGQKLNTTACVSRWQIASLPSEAYEGLPGMGFPKWRVALLRMRNGKTGSWEVQWIDGKFASIQEATATHETAVAPLENKQRKVG